MGSPVARAVRIVPTMALNTRALKCAPMDVFRVLGDGWLYPSWVVGASRMRDVDETWPRAGSGLHHSVGVWPILIDDKTSVTEWSPPYRMELRARAWPLGEAAVVIDVRGSGHGSCLVRIQEEARRGPARGIPRSLFDALIHWRNTETLHRLAYLAEGMAVQAALPSTADEERS